MASKIVEILQFIAAIVFFFLHVGDIVSDIVACITYNSNGHDSFFKASLAFIIIPFGYIIWLGTQEAGGFDNVTMCSSYFYTFSGYFLGPLFPYVFKGKLSDENIKKVEGICAFGSGYMEDIPQVVIAVLFVFSSLNKDATNREKLIALVQLGFSALSGIFKIVSGAAKIGGGKVNCCGRDIAFKL